MTFLNPWILIAWCAVAVPIVIHLLNRRSAKMVDWGAMHFLLGSMVQRKRRVLLEELLLLACRCMLIALAVLAVARPVIPVGSSVAWAVVLPLALVAAVAFAVGTAFWSQRFLRWSCYATGLVLATLVFGAIALEHILHLGTLMGQSRDVVLLVDGSASMAMESNGQSNFDRAISEAKDLIRSLKGSATVSILEAGPVPEAKTPYPLTDSEQLGAVLDGMKPTGGMMALHDALRTASLWLSMGTNTAKQIVLLTDGQRAGWDAGAAERWAATAREIRTVQGVQPQCFCRLYELPSEPRNLAIAELVFGRSLVGTDRPLPIRARVVNTGKTRVSATLAHLLIDAKEVDRLPLRELEPGAAEVLGFFYRFAQAGPHVTEVRIDVEDDQPADNHLSAALHVIDRLPVLVIDGQQNWRLFDRASGFVHLALDPASIPNRGTPVPNPKEPNVKEASAKDLNRLIDVTVLTPGQVHEFRDWNRYRTAILIGVPNLQKEAASRLADFVTQGGGLLVVPPSQAQSEFYNHWSTMLGDQSHQVLPAKLVRRVSVPEDQTTVQLLSSSMAHPALQSVRDAKKNDLDTSRVNGYWLLEPQPGEGQTLVAARLTGDIPWLVEQRLGQGRVMMTATSLDLHDSNLPSRKSFLPLVHASICHLAEDVPWHLALLPGRKPMLRLPMAKAQSDAPSPDAGGPLPLMDQAPRVQIIAPNETQLDATCRLEENSLIVETEVLSMPGVYHLKLSDLMNPDAKKQEVPFTVESDPAESSFDPLSEGELTSLSDWINLQTLRSSEELQTIGSGRPHGLELWKSMAVMAFLMAVMEVALAWWVAKQRKAGPPEKFDFASRTVSPEFQEQLLQVQSH